MKKLETLHFGGCPHLTAHHLSHLACLENLTEICIGSSFFGAHACTVLSTLKMKKLKLNCCFGLSTLPFIEQPISLRHLCVANCSLDEDQLSELLSSHLMHQLRDFRFVCIEWTSQFSHTKFKWLGSTIRQISKFDAPFSSGKKGVCCYWLSCVTVELMIRRTFSQISVTATLRSLQKQSVGVCICRFVFP